MVVSLQLAPSTLHTYTRNAALQHVDMHVNLQMYLMRCSHGILKCDPCWRLCYLYIYICVCVGPSLKPVQPEKKMHPGHRLTILQSPIFDQAKEERRSWKCLCKGTIGTFVNRRSFEKEGKRKPHVQRLHVSSWFLRVGARNLHIFVQNTVSPVL